MLFPFDVSAQLGFLIVLVFYVQLEHQLFLFPFFYTKEVMLFLELRFSIFPVLQLFLNFSVPRHKIFELITFTLYFLLENFHGYNIGNVGDV